MGAAVVRRLLYLPALSALRFQPRVRVFCDRLLAKGKPKMVALAAMAQLLRIAYGSVGSELLSLC